MSELLDEKKPAHHWQAMWKMSTTLGYAQDHIQELYEKWQEALKMEQETPTAQDSPASDSSASDSPASDSSASDSPPPLPETPLSSEPGKFDNPVPSELAKPTLNLKPAQTPPKKTNPQTRKNRRNRPGRGRRLLRRF